MSLLDALRGSGPRQQVPGQPSMAQRGRVPALPDAREKFHEIAQNPGELGQVFQIPPGMTDGEQILQHLINTRQVNPAMVQNPMVLRAVRWLTGG